MNTHRMRYWAIIVMGFVASSIGLATIVSAASGAAWTYLLILPGFAWGIALHTVARKISAADAETSR